MIGRIYLVTCELTGKWYFGQTIKSIQSRFNEHFRSAQRGSDHKFSSPYFRMARWNFLVEKVLTVSAPTKEKLKAKLDFLEKHFIQKFDTRRNGYNSTDGGESKLGYVTSEETKRKIRFAQLGERGNRFGKKHSSEVIEKLRKMNLGERNPMFGRKLSEETRRKMSESHRISAQLESPEQRKKRGDAMRGKPGINRGKKFSQEVRLKMSNSHKLRYQNHECKNFV